MDLNKVILKKSLRSYGVINHCVSSKDIFFKDQLLAYQIVGRFTTIPKKTTAFSLLKI